MGNRPRIRRGRGRKDCTGDRSIIGSWARRGADKKLKLSCAARSRRTALNLKSLSTHRLKDFKQLRHRADAASSPA